jgi:biotin carboxyl carrier protein
MQFNVIVDGERLSGTLHRTPEGKVEATIGDHSYTLTVAASEPAIYWLQLGDQSIEIVVVPNSSGYTVSIGKTRFEVEIEDARSALRRTNLRAHDGAAEIKAPMPGKIVRLLASEGNEIKANQGIVVMEAMKMQNEIKSPRNGFVKKLCVTVGATVNAGDLLATVEDA